MAPTQPSDSIQDFVTFMTAMFGRDVYASRRGATQEDVVTLARCCPHPFPQLYREYLLEFGEDAGGFEFAFDTLSDIQSLLAFHDPDEPPLPPEQPEDCFVFAIENASGGRVLDFSDCKSGKSTEPTVASYYADDLDYTYSKTFRIFLYGAGFIEGRIKPPRPSRWTLISQVPSQMQDLLAVAVRCGFVPYWFSDEYMSCLERGGESLVMRTQGGMTSIVVVASDDAKTADIRSQLLQSFPLVAEKR